MSHRTSAVDTRSVAQIPTLITALIETEWDPVGPSQVQILFVSPVSYLEEKGFSFQTFPEYQRADSNSY